MYMCVSIMNKKQIKQYMKDKIKKHKQQNPCPCGEKDISKLTFHHRDPDKKRYKVSDMPHRCLSIRKLEKEIGKCQVLCRTCHDFVHGVVRE